MWQMLCEECNVTNVIWHVHCDKKWIVMNEIVTFCFLLAWIVQQLAQLDTIMRFFKTDSGAIEPLNYDWKKLLVGTFEYLLLLLSIFINFLIFGAI